MKKFLCTALVGASALFAISGSAFAQTAPQSIGEFRDWTAWVQRDQSSKVCFMTSEPQSSTPKGANRGDIYVYVTHRPAQNTYGEVAVRLGYPAAKDKEAIASVGAKSVRMMTNGQNAWTANPSDDRPLVNAMKAGRDMKVAATSQRGTRTNDTYSLLGFTAAYNAISKACK